ncbi:hypothetical protein [Streptomyces sp. HPF1205]|uniref:hypothetical protein n=1 Tax=Streptomyces sp. HPF1205 TaxID=2873262 RepID=UPI001CEC8E7A|nr:hypothetical protein [Streptomyces sp. HPF1205]
MSDLNVTPGALRTSAAMADGVNSEDLHLRIGHALTATEAASEALRGWLIGAELQELADSWRPALRGLQERISATAQALRECAASHDWNETLTGRDFEGI